MSMFHNVSGVPRKKMEHLERFRRCIFLKLVDTISS